MRMTKYDLTTEIAMLCDELEAAKREAEELRGMPASETGEVQTISALDARFMRVGRQRVFEDSTYSWSEVSAHKDEESGKVLVTKYERFVSEKTNKIPSYMSEDEFRRVFDKEFRTCYEKEKAEALEKLKGDENE